MKTKDLVPLLFFTALLIGMVLFVSNQAVKAEAVAPIPAGYDLYGLDVFNTKPFECGEQFHTQWVNDRGDIRIYQAQLWLGMYPGNVSDFGYQVHRVSDESLLYRGNWDHYADPTGLDGQLHHLNFTPNYFELAEGDALELWYKCQNKGDIGHVILTIWFTEQ